MKKTAPAKGTKTSRLTAKSEGLPKELTTVTPFTKLLAVIIIIGSVVLAFVLGRLYQLTLPV